MISATIRYPYDKRILDLFAPEGKSFPRASYSIQQESDSLIFAIEASDSVALRSAMTTITKILSVWEATSGHGPERHA